MRTTLIVCSLVVFLVCPSRAFAQVVELKDGVERLAADLAKTVPAGRTLRIAVTDLPDLQGVTSNLGRYIAERLTTRLSAQPDRFRVVERRRLGQVLGELNFGMSDLVDPSKAKQLGRLLGVEAIVVGTLSDLGNSMDIDARIIEIETSNILPGISVAISKDDTVRRMSEEGRAAASGPAPSSGTTTAPASGARQPQKATIQISADWLNVELLSAERSASSIRFTMLFTNLRDRETSVYIYDPRDINRNYLIDDLGNRYKLVAGSDIARGEVTLPSKVPVRHWLAFEAPEGSAAQVHVFFVMGGGNVVAVAIRNVFVPR